MITLHTCLQSPILDILQVAPSWRGAVRPCINRMVSTRSRPPRVMLILLCPSVPYGTLPHIPVIVLDTCITSDILTVGEPYWAQDGCHSRRDEGMRYHWLYKKFSLYSFLSLYVLYGVSYAWAGLND